MQLRTFIAAGLAIVSLAGSASAAPVAAAKPKAASQCFWTRDVNGFQAQDDSTVNIRVGVKDIYQLKLFSPAPDIDWTQRIGIESRGGSWICSGLDATIIVPGSIGPQRYPVTSVRKLSLEEVAALPAKAKP